MKKQLTVTAIALLALCAPAFAQQTIGELISESGLREGPVAFRDVPGWSASRKILVWDRGFQLSELKTHFQDANIVIVSSLEDALAHAADAGAIVGSCNGELLAAAGRVTWVQIFSSGAERCVDLPQIASGKVILSNMQKMSSPTIAEHVIAMLLSLTRNLPQFSRIMEDGRWARGPVDTAGMSTVAGKTLLVLGLGGIGTEVARRANALGMKVIGTRNSKREGPPFVEYVGLADEILTLAGRSDFIVNALPLTDATRGSLNADFFSAVPRGAYFVNVGRGATVDTDALVDALKGKRLAGAGLDVIDPEPLPSDHPLWKLDNVLITPHVSARGGGRTRHTLLLVENLKRYIAGDALLNVVDPQKGY